MINLFKAMSIKVYAVVIALLFACGFGFMVLKNNANLAIVTAAFIDSGSLLGDYMKLAESDEFNQSLMYHTSIYGWPGNSLSIWMLWLAENVNFEAKGALARSLSFIMSISGLVGMGTLLERLNANKAIAVSLLVFVALWAPFVVFSYQIHPEAFGLFFATAALIACVRYEQSSSHVYLLIGWAMALLAFLSKQPFLIYLIVPLNLGMGTLMGSERKIHTFILYAATFTCVGLATVFLSDPYIILDFQGFLSKQVAIHTHHLHISNSPSHSAGQWARILIFSDPWFLLALVASAVVSVKSHSQFLKACALANFVFLFVLIFLLKFFFLRSYLYPALPTSLVVIAALPTLVPRRVELPTTVVVVFGLIGLAGYNSVTTLGSVMSSSSFSQTTAVDTMNEISSHATGDITAVYSANLPLNSAPFGETYNSFQFTTDNTVEAVVSLAPDIIIVDKLWPHNDPKLYEAAARRLGLVKFTVTGKRQKALCDYQGSSSLVDCMSASFGEHGSAPLPVYEIYVGKHGRKLISSVTADIFENGLAY